jgi:hypothetical protein
MTLGISPNELKVKEYKIKAKKIKCNEKIE